MIAWVIKNRMKIGMRICTDSFTPRRLRTIKAIMVRYSQGSFQPWAVLAEKAEYRIAPGRD